MLAEQIEVLARKRHQSVSDVIRIFTEKGMNAESYADKVDPIREIIRQEVDEAVKKQTNRIAALLNRNTILSASSYYKQQRADKTALKAAQKRLAELEKLTQSLYEDKVLSSVPEAVFKSLMAKYEMEREEKTALLQELSVKLSQTEKDEHEIEAYLQSIRKYVAVEALDREMLLELINYIEVGERKQLGEQKYRDIVIHYNLVDKAG